MVKFVCESFFFFFSQNNNSRLTCSVETVGDEFYAVSLDANWSTFYLGHRAINCKINCKIRSETYCNERNFNFNFCQLIFED